MDELRRLPKCRPALNYYLRRRLAGRIRRRLPVALHQRARPRQHPEGRHLFRRAAHVGRRHQRRANCAPSPTWSTSSQSRPSRSRAASASTCSASRKEDLPGVWADLGKAGMVSGHAYAKGAAHGEDLRRLRLVPLRHAGFDGPRRPHREIHVGLVDAGQGQDGRLGLPAQLRRGDLQGRRRHLRRHRLRDPFRRRGGARHQGHGSARLTSSRRTRRSNMSPRWCSSIASRAAISNASTNGPSASASKKSAGRSSTDTEKRKALFRPLRLQPEIRAGRPVVGARLGQGQARVRANGDHRLGAGGGVGIHDLCRHRKTLRHSAAGRAMRRHAARQDRRLPHRRGSRLRARGSLPA